MSDRGNGVQEGQYSSDQRETLAEAPGLRVRILGLSAGQEVPWHYHTIITDTFFCMRGPIRVSTRNPDATHSLRPGETLSVKPGVPHHVESDDVEHCQFMVVQGVGEYDYVEL